MKVEIPGTDGQLRQLTVDIMALTSVEDHVYIYSTTLARVVATDEKARGHDN